MAKKKRISRSLPQMQCFLACDAVSRDPNSSKHSLYGIFDIIYADEFPGMFKPFNLFVKLVGGSGRHTISFEPDVPGKKTPTTQNEPTEIVLDPRQSADIAVSVAPVPLLKVGVVKFTMLFDGVPLGWPCAIQIKKPNKER